MKLRMKLEEINVESFEISPEQEEMLARGVVKTFDPTKCDPHSCVPTFPC